LIHSFILRITSQLRVVGDIRTAKPIKKINKPIIATTMDIDLPYLIFNIREYFSFCHTELEKRGSSTPRHDLFT